MGERECCRNPSSDTTETPPNTMPTVPQEPTTEPSGSGSNTGAIVGGIIGGLVAVAVVSGAAFYFGKNKSSAPLVPTLSVRNPSIVPAGVEMADEENIDHDYMGQSNPMYDNDTEDM